MTQLGASTLAPATLARAKTLLLVDDSDATRVATKWFLNNFGYAVDSVRSPAEALSLFDPHIHDLVVTVNSRTGMSGVEMAHVIKLRSPATPVIMYTGDAPEDQSCLDLVIPKPVHVLALKEALDTLLTERGAVPQT